MTQPLLKPTLYAANPHGEPTLLGGRCACGYVFFPFQTYGCERCGKFGDALTAYALQGKGRLVASTVVHAHADPRRTAPFVIGTVALDEGPVVRTLLEASPMTMGSGTRVRAKFVPVKTEQGEALDLRFAVDTSEVA